MTEEEQIQEQADTLVPMAYLDENDVYQEIRFVKPSEAHPIQHLTHITTCDLPAGKYKYDRETKQFVALGIMGAHQMSRFLADASTMDGIIKGIEHCIMQIGTVLAPQETKDMIKRYNTLLTGTRNALR